MGEDGEQLTLTELHERSRPPETQPVSVRLPEPLVAELDDIWRGEFDTRSAFVRAVLEHVAANPESFRGVESADVPGRPER